MRRASSGVAPGPHSEREGERGAWGSAVRPITQTFRQTMSCSGEPQRLFSAGFWGLNLTSSLSEINHAFAMTCFLCTAAQMALNHTQPCAFAHADASYSKSWCQVIVSAGKNNRSTFNSRKPEPGLPCCTKRK